MMPQQKLVAKNKTKLQKPKFYAVIIFNDEITTMDFVVEVLNKIFDKPLDEATKLMLEIHQNGKAIVGVYTYDIAITKKHQVDTLSTENNYPLKIIVEEYNVCI